MLFICDLVSAQEIIVNYGDTNYMIEVDSGRYYRIKAFDLKPSLPDGLYKVRKKFRDEGDDRTYLYTVATYKNGVKEGYVFEYLNFNGNRFKILHIKMEYLKETGKRFLWMVLILLFLQLVYMLTEKKKACG